MGKFMELVEKWAGGGPGGSKRSNTIRWILIVGLVGFIIMILNSFVQVKEVDPLSESRASPQEQTEPVLGKAKESSDFQTIEETIEMRIKDILEKIVGVGVVDVLVTVDSTAEMIFDRNTKDAQQITDETDANGAKRHITDVTRSGDIVFYEVSGNQTPIEIKKVKPKIRGVLIVANGAENVVVKKLIKEAVERGLSVAAHRISIVPRKQ